MDELETFLRVNASYSPNRLRLAPVADALREHRLRPLSAGIQARVFRVEGQPWVVKEGRWDLELQLFSTLTLPLYAQLTENVLKQFSFTFLPTKRQIRKQYKQYLRILRYLGCFAEGDYEHPELAAITSSQRELRDSLPDALPALERSCGLQSSPVLREIVESPLRYHNFLPKEYLLMGESISPQNKGKVTFYIFQEFVEGTPLHDVRLPHLPELRQREMILLLLLTLLMSEQIKLVPDTRPRYPFVQAYDWLTKTDNIFVADGGVKFIDTRWFWETDANFVRRGAIIPEITLMGAKGTLASLVRRLQHG